MIFLQLTKLLKIFCFGALLLYLSGCSISYQKHHQTKHLNLFHNSDHPPHDLNPVWAESVLEILSDEFGISLEDITPVDVYIDCNRNSRRPSRFNRLTKSIVLRVGQAEIHRLFIHEATHLLLDNIDSFPPYWIDQGLAEYMESRCQKSFSDVPHILLPALLEWTAVEIEKIGLASVDKALNRLSKESMDQGWGWATPFIHYLLRYRWADWPSASRYRRLIELTEEDVQQLAFAFIQFYRFFDLSEDYAKVYSSSNRSTRLALLRELHWRFNIERKAIFENLLFHEKDPAFLNLIAGELLLLEESRDVDSSIIK